MLKLASLFRLLSLLFVLGSAVSIAYAVDLPPSSWYAVAWVIEPDTLHWIDASGEQASIPRPKLADESDERGQPALWIAPDGRTLVTAAPLTNERWGLGFYDFASGQWIQTHQTQAGEVVLGSGDFTTTSSHFAVTLRSEATGDWRVIVFETASGSAAAQLNRSDAFIPDTVYDDPSWYPLIISFDVDEGLGTPSLRLVQRSTSDDAQTYVGGVPSFRWYPLPPPALANAPVVQDTLGVNPLPGLDVLKTTGQALAATVNPQGAAPSAFVGDQIVLLGQGQGQSIPLVSDSGYTLSNPYWLRDGEWIGYRVENEVMLPYYAVTTLEGGDGLPLGPNLGAIYPTPDGFLAADAESWQLYHATDLNFEGFATSIGSVVFEAGMPFGVIYTTPEGASFSLTTLAQPIVLGGQDIAAPNAASIPPCPNAPAPRLTPGSTARVAFTNGTPLNLRSAPAAALTGQLPEGTVFAVTNAAPQCVNGYLWWNVQLNDASTHWAAEGDSSGYFVEPYQETFQVATPMGAAPTQAPLGVAIPVTAAPLVPMPTLACLNSPQSRLTVGGIARVIGTNGTLAVYNTATEPFPTYQLPLQQTVSIIGGPQCREGIRMWQVSTTLNNTPITGWVSEGFGQAYFLEPM